MLKIQIISSKNCELCQAYLQRLKKLNFEDYQIYSADDSSHAKQLDEWKITDMPIVQIVDEQGSEKYRFPHSSRGYTPRLLKSKLKELNQT